MTFTTAEATPASHQDPLKVHSPEYLKRLTDVCARGGGWMDADTPAGPNSFEVAARAAGACCTAVDSTLLSGFRTGIRFFGRRDGHRVRRRGSAPRRPNRGTSDR
ncbi:MAG: hypothetical protein ACR2FO_04065 [Actinomycetota bacterium]